ncbi:hypothetical protein [Mycobacteroides abscessus]|uniref:Uncharacterized protein n=1 Tax=Mycobacteroides abscessus subsp. massiliense TaxID=1962118 RepID=A0A1T8TIN8_9MYCO|nr:hypothetical protein [Mycobacteroides abscessus]SKM80463.1 Uncharacterised protein [Mycobacteroides abscessus subsp. massiliense]SKT64117.1 Uncharacterised protein [Mycobacteroides abscessus subsp. massiliense]SKT91737.1 Uncharacterised protein [Mycobacteroides abscessus subsp. massiliense]SKX37576.1 Uncharacterised protein [Mycobacteroides abscessus subsp. massiliense]
MTQVNVHVIGGRPLVRLSGPVVERTGSELAANIMSSIYFMTEDGESGKPLSLEAPRIRAN